MTKPAIKVKQVQRGFFINKDGEREAMTTVVPIELTVQQLAYVKKRAKVFGLTVSQQIQHFIANEYTKYPM